MKSMLPHLGNRLCNSEQMPIMDVKRDIKNVHNLKRIAPKTSVAIACCVFPSRCPAMGRSSVFVSVHVVHSACSLGGGPVWSICIAVDAL
eukprot:5794828-Amphidinium_carterae.1